MNVGKGSRQIGLVPSEDGLALRTRVIGTDLAVACVLWLWLWLSGYFYVCGKVSWKISTGSVSSIKGNFDARVHSVSHEWSTRN